MKNSRNINVIVGFLLYLSFVAFFTIVMKCGIECSSAIGCVVWMAYWWVTSAVDGIVTALLPIAVNAIVPMADMSSVISNYASETTLLLFGTSILVSSWEKTGLDRRIAVRFLLLIGDNYRKQLIFWFVLSAVLSVFLPNAVVCATITPIAVAMLKYIGEADIRNSKIASKLLLSIVYAVGVGGLASPLGGSMNLISVEYIQQITGKEYMYFSWVIRFLPFVIVLCISNIMFLIRDIEKSTLLGESKRYFQEQYEKMDAMTEDEKLSLYLFILAASLSFLRPLYQELFPSLKPAYIFISFGVLSFAVIKRDGNRLINWKSVQNKIVWELMYMFSGGVAIGTLINSSGAAEYIGSAMSKICIKDNFCTVLFILIITIILSDITSNTAAAAITIPIVISIIKEMGEDPIPYIYLASIGINLSYMLPTSIRAIPVGYGLSPKYMLKEGSQITCLVIALMSIMGFIALKFCLF